MAQKPKLSVIVPVYNVADYLDWCLDSLAEQTCADLEILCVNDGSTDNSHEILVRRQEQDPRIVIIDKENGGLSSARNAGIKAAKAPVVCFLDSDDQFTPDAAEVIVQTFANEQPDVVTFGAHCYPREAAYPWLTQHLSPRDVVYEPFHPDLLFKEMSRPFAWRTAVRTDFLRDNNLYFDESVAFGEDQIFHFALYPRAHKTVLISNKLYEYRVAREGSLMDRVVKDPFTKMQKHVDITAVILADANKPGSYVGDDFSDQAVQVGKLVDKPASKLADRQSLLDACPAHMMEWVVEFLLNETFDLPQGQRNEILGLIRPILLQYWDIVTVRESAAPEPVKQILCASMREATFSDKEAKQLLRAYRQQGGFAKRVVRKLMGR